MKREINPFYAVISLINYLNAVIFYDFIDDGKNKLAFVHVHLLQVLFVCPNNFFWAKNLKKTFLNFVKSFKAIWFALIT